MTECCRVYWGSHGCKLPRGHDGPHVCDCAPTNWRERLAAWWDWKRHGVANVGAPPYYGELTRFYGEDAAALGLPLVTRLTPEQLERLRRATEGYRQLGVTMGEAMRQLGRSLEALRRSQSKGGK